MTTIPRTRFFLALAELQLLMPELGLEVIHVWPDGATCFESAQSRADNYWPHKDRSPADLLDELEAAERDRDLLETMY